jgi:hypothetical protein
MTKKSAWNLFSVGCLLLTTACGKEAGRVPFAAEDTKSVALQLEAGDVAFWTDLDVKYDGAADLAYTIELEQAGAAVGNAVCNPLGQLNVKLGWVETNFNGARSASGSGKMACGLSLAKGGVTNVRATLAVVTRPATFTLSKADLIIKQ